MRKLFKERKLFKGGNYMRKYGMYISLYRSSWGPTGILYLTLIMCCVQATLYSSMWFISRKQTVPTFSNTDNSIEMKNQSRQ